MKEEHGNITVPKVPTILCDPSSWESFGLFNPNDWSARSKDVISSAGAQYGLIIYQTKMMKELNKKSDIICYERYRGFESQWNQSKWELDKGIYFVEIPEVHLYIQSIFSTIKTYLDLIVQLISTESIVSGVVDGFHKSGDVIGGRLIKVLLNNSVDGRKKQAQKIHDLFVDHKDKWIDRSVKYRDIFTHPGKGLRTVMFELVLQENGDQLNLMQIRKPEIDGKIFDAYSEDMVKKINDFTKKFLYLVVHAKLATS